MIQKQFKFIRLTELVAKKEGDVGERPMLLNPVAIVLVSEADFLQDEIIIVGQSKKKTVCLIALVNGTRIFVKESLDKVGSLINSQLLSKNGDTDNDPPESPLGSEPH